jgi:Fe2+ or Zn2+ uptake regulation protein
MSSKRNTVQKQLILDAVGQLDIHATAEQVYEHVALAHPSVSKATVYRNLRLMAEAGELLNIGSFNGSTHYDHRCHEHSHFVCERCKRVFDIEGDFSDIASRAGKTNGVTINAYHLFFSGICQECEGSKE